MTKKDYILIAKILARTYETSSLDVERETVIVIINQLIVELKIDNPNFKPATFIKACIN